MECRYKYCKHDPRTIDEDDCVKVGHSYYHKDCYEEKSAIDKVIDLWSTSIDPNPIYAELRRHINAIVYDWKFPAKKLLFYLEWAVNTNWGIKHPAGLRYLVKSDDAEKAWKNRTVSKKRDVIEDDTATFRYVPPKTRNIGDILGG